MGRASPSRLKSAEKMALTLEMKKSEYLKKPRTKRLVTTDDHKKTFDHTLPRKRSIRSP